MPVLRGNDVVSINGTRISQQGIGYLATNVTPASAAEKTKANGMDEIILAVQGDNGATEHVLVYGDSLDFSFRDKNAVPQVTVNGRPAMILAFEDEVTTGGERGWRGVKQGLGEAGDTLSNIAKKTMERAPIFTGAAFMAGTGWVIVGKGAALATMRTAVSALARPVAMAGLAVVGIGSLVILANALIKGLSGNVTPKMETLAGVMSDKPLAGASLTGPSAPAAAPAANREAEATRAPLSSNNRRRPLR